MRTVREAAKPAAYALYGLALAVLFFCAGAYRGTGLLIWHLLPYGPGAAEARVLGRYAGIAADGAALWVSVDILLTRLAAGGDAPPSARPRRRRYRGKRLAPSGRRTRLPHPGSRLAVPARPPVRYALPLQTALRLTALCLCAAGTAVLIREGMGDALDRALFSAGEQAVLPVREMLAREKYIIHAGGFLTDSGGALRSYTNSREALDRCYRDGNRVAELDFLETADGALVCGHAASEEPLTYQAFLESGAAREFTPLDLAYLAEFLTEHPDFYVVTDVKGDNVSACRAIMRRWPELADRFLIQIYHEAEYRPIRAIGFRHILFTLYRTEAAERLPANLRSIAARLPLAGFAVSEYMARDAALVEALESTGVPRYIHTVNDRAARRAYLAAGFAAVYTDVTDNAGDR